jgi:MFS family permease
MGRSGLIDFSPPMWNGQIMTDALGAAYWRLWTSAGMSDLADGIVKVALPLVAIGYTRSPGLIAGLAFAFTLPWLLFALPAGMLVDRLDRRRAMLGANCVRGALMLVLVVLVALGLRSIWGLYFAAFCVGTAETLYDTSAQSIIPQVVPRDQLSRANARLYAAQMTANEFIGPPAAGLLVAAGAVAAFATPVGLWMVAVGALLLVRGSFKVPSAGSGMRAEIAEGLRFVWRNRVLRTFAIMVGVSNFATNAMMAVFVLYAVGRHSEMGLSRVEYGVLLAVIPAGSLLGSVVAERVEASFGRARSLAVSSVSVAVLVGIAAVTANVFVVGAAFFAGGVGIIIMNVIMVSLRQRMTPDRLLGRVNSCYRLVAWGTMPLGTVAAGVLGSTIGLRWLFAIMGLLGLTTAFGLLVANDAAMDASESAAPADGLATAEA